MIRLGIASWTDLGSIWGPKGVPKGLQIGLKTEPKWHRKFTKKSERFLVDLKTSYPGTALQHLSGLEPWEGQGGGTNPSPRGLGLGFGRICDCP